MPATSRQIFITREIITNRNIFIDIIWDGLQKSQKARRTTAGKEFIRIIFVP
jgi:hypothetical protein